MQGVATGVAVYGGIQSAMALSGVESEKLRETLVKLQAAQTLMNSINQVATAFEKESALMLTLKTAKTKALTVATGAYAAVTGTTTGLLKVFRIALASTGIGLIVVAIGALIANFDKLTKVFKPVINGLKAVGDAIGLTNFAKDERMEQTKKQMEFERQMAEQELKAHNARMDQYRAEQAEQDALISKEIELAEARGEDTTEMQRAQLEKRLQDLKDNLQKEEDAFQEAEGDYVQYIKKEEADLQAALLFLRQKGVTDFRYLSREQQDEYEKTFKTTRKSISTLERSLVSTQKRINNVLTTEREKFGKTTQAQIDQAAKDIEIFEARTTKSQKAEQKKKADNYKKYLQDRLNAQRKIEDIENSMMEEGIEKELKLNQVKFRRLREDAEKNTNLTLKERKELNDLYTEQQEQSETKIREKYDQKEIDEQLKLQAELDKIKEANEARFRTDEENELLAVAAKYDKLQAMAQGNAEALEQIEIARLNEKNAIELKYQEEAYKNEKIINDKKIEDEKAVADAKKSIQDAQIANVEAGIALLKDVAGENNKLQALAIAAENAVGIAKIIISTQAANAAAKLKYAAIPGGLALAAAEITANKISAGIGIAASVAAAAKGIASLKASAPLDSGGDLGGGGGGAGGGDVITPEFNVVGESGINQLAQLQQQPVQAYVVSGEVTTGQALDRNRVQNATL
jgi:hypothetical protein